MMAFDTSNQDADALALARFAAGDRASARELTERLTPAIYGLAYRMLGDTAEAEDVAQEAMLRLWKIAPDWQAGQAKVSTWLYRVTQNLCTDRFRKRQPGQLPEEWDVADETPGAEAGLQTKGRLAALQHALNMLPERQRQAVVLRHIEGLANPEIAAIMEISVEAVESLSARGKRTLARHLGAMKDELGFEDEV